MMKIVFLIIFVATCAQAAAKKIPKKVLRQEVGELREDIMQMRDELAECLDIDKRLITRPQRVKDLQKKVMKMRKLYRLMDEELQECHAAELAAAEAEAAASAAAVFAVEAGADGTTTTESVVG